MVQTFRSCAVIWAGGQRVSPQVMFLTSGHLLVEDRPDLR